MARFKSIAFGLIFSAAFAHGQCTGLNTPVANGGTGACTAAQALSNLGAQAALGYAPANCTAGTAANNCLKLNASALVPAGNLPNPTASTLGGIESITSAAHNWVAYIDTSGIPHQSQPAYTDISGIPQLANTIAAVSHQWLNSYTASSGNFTQTQPTLADIAAGIAPTGTFDFSGSTQLKHPVTAAYASLANGELGYDSTNKNWHAWGNAADNFVALLLASGTYTNGHCLQLSNVSSVLTLVDAGSACGSDSGGGTSGWSGTPLTFISTTTQYAPPVGGGLTSSTESVSDVASPVAQTISNLSVSLSAALGAGATLQVTLRDGGVSQALTCTTAAGGASCVDSTHSFNVAKGDLIDFQLVSSGTVTAGIPQIVVTYAAGTSSVGVTSIATTGPITGGPITSTGTIACATCVTSATSLTSNALMTGAGSQGSQTVTTGNGVVSALGTNTGSAGAVGVLLAVGTAAMNTAAVGSGSCETVVTVSASNVATTDVIEVGFNGDPTAVTGYGASATGAVLTIYPYPTSGNVNFKVCNSTSGSITPSALTLNWKVYR